MSGWHCPNCHTFYKDGDYPDHWQAGNAFNFECENCRAEFVVSIEWSPQFYVMKSTPKLLANPSPEKADLG